MSASIGVIIAVCILLVVILALLISSVRIVSQTNQYIIQRMGGYYKTWGVGVHFLVPFIDRVAKIVVMKEQVKDFDPQSVITKDNITMQIDTVIFFQVT
ncbi:MAG: SPFH domain-containing protein, partial [Anaeroplasmataceae bacterium]